MRKTLILALMCAASLAACKKEDEGTNVGPEPGAPPLVAGIDEGAKPGDPGYDPRYSTGGQATPGADAAPAATPGATTGAAAPRVAAAAADGSRPTRKAGLWEITRVTTGGPPPGAFGLRAGGAPGGTAGAAPGGAARGGGQGGPGGGGFGRGPQGPEKLCVDAASEAMVGVFTSPRSPGCTPKLAKAGKGWSQSFTCQLPARGDGPARTQTSNQTLSGDLNSKYTVHGTSKMTGGEGQAFTTTTTITGVYKGACPAGQKGGDMTDASGQTRNILQARGGFGGGGRRAGGGE